MKDPKQRRFDYCEERKRTEYSGVVIKTVGTAYILTNNQRFRRFCANSNVQLDIGDSVYKASGTQDYYIFKFNPDTSFFIDCPFDCDTLIKK